MQQYFTNNFSFDKDDVHHIKKVMRSRTGDKVLVVENKIKYIATLEVTDESVTISTKEETLENNENKNELTLCVGLLKKDKFDWVIQKASELGVTRIIPTIFHRNIVDIKGKEEKKLIRWNKIAKEACEQAKRNAITEITQPMTIAQISALTADSKVVCYESKEGNHLNKAINGSAIIVIGPEGGIEQKEIETLTNKGYTIATLSKQILRAETAAIAAAVMFNEKEW